VIHRRFGYHAAGEMPSAVAAGQGVGRSAVGSFIDIDVAPSALLRELGKDPRLIPYGGANFGMPLDLVEPNPDRIIANDRFFVRSNGPIPVIDPEAWRLSIAGAVDRPLALSLSDLQQLPTTQLEAFLECAGNGRTRFDPIPPGTPWRNDAVGNAVWEGVPLAAVLDLVGIQSETVDLVTQGGDFPEMRRGLPLAIARSPDVLIVWAMNGEPLPIAHGGPVRLLVPGWAGIASTKWLIGIEALDRAFDGFWNTDNYVFWDEHGAALRPIAEMPPKSIIVAPEDGAVLAAGPVTIAGWAWSGHGRIVQVDVSVDGGCQWQDAQMHHGERHGWRRWELPWQAAPGAYRISARAVDERGLTQPTHAPWNAKGYLMNAMHQISVQVDS
jgi:DMSO/TMAO reductase YedYZ molybdopterin-dependent catalytic subunit